MSTTKDTTRLDDAENWVGGGYGLVVQLGPSDDARLEYAAEVLWRLAGVVSAPAGGRRSSSSRYLRRWVVATLAAS